jgi:competence CoiA-like predicted nuclease
MDCTKDHKYYCSECGEELVIKDGSIKIKHLSHKNSSKCKGTGESIYHRMWKEHMFYKGSQIYVDGIYYEVTNILIETSLKHLFATDWNIDIVPDIILATSGGYVVVEILYTNKKDWMKLDPYYQSIKDKILKVFEVDVGIAVNEAKTWRTKDEIIAEINKKIEQRKIKEEKQLNKKWIIDNKINKYKCFFNSSCKPHKIDNHTFAVSCFISNESYIQYGTGNQALLIFDTTKQYITEERMKRNFNIPFKQGNSMYSKFEVSGDVKESPCLIVNSFYDLIYSMDEPCLVKKILAAADNANKMIDKYLKSRDT